MGYDNRIRTKYTAKWGVQIAGMIFQIHSSVACRYAAKQWNPVSFCMNFVMIHYCSLTMSDSDFFLTVFCDFLRNMI